MYKTYRDMFQILTIPGCLVLLSIALALYKNCWITNDIPFHFLLLPFFGLLKKKTLSNPTNFLPALMKEILKPALIINKNGKIITCNEAFENVISQNKHSSCDNNQFPKTTRDILLTHIKQVNHKPIYFSCDIQHFSDKQPVNCMLKALMDNYYLLTIENPLTNDGINEDTLKKMGPEEIKKVALALQEKLDSSLQIEEMLRKSEERYRGIIQTTTAGISITDKIDNLLFVNEAFAHILGYQVEEMQHKNLKEFIENEEYEKISNERENRHQGISSQYELKMNRKDGKTITLLIFAAPLASKEGDYNESIAVITNISERKKIEENFRSFKNNLQNVLNAIPFGIILIGEDDKKIKGVNDYILSLLQCDKTEDLTEKYCHEIVIGCTREDCGACNTATHHEEGFILSCTKDKIPIIKNIVPVEFNEEKILLLALIDIRERKKMENELLNAKEKAEESDKLKSAFLANMSHEIRTPLNAILGFSNLLSDPALSFNQRNQYISLVNQGGENLTNIIDNIIDIAKIESGQLKLKKKHYSLTKQLIDIVDYYNEIKTDKSKEHIDIRLTHQSVVEDIHLFNDAVRIEQVLKNLIDNALKFTQKGYIEIHANIKEDQLIISVKDTGIGIPQKKIATIFERFMKAHEDKTILYSGTGLGLTITKNLVELMNGQIWVESTPGNGSCFHVSIPYYLPESKPETLHKPPENMNKEYDWSQKTVLIAEDEESNYLYLKEILKKTGISIIWAQNGKEAVDIFMEKNTDIQLVLMDIKMPIMNGHEAIEKILQISNNIPIITQTAFSMEEEKEKCLQAGCVDYIAKPIRKNELLRIIDKHIV